MTVIKSTFDFHATATLDPRASDEAIATAVRQLVEAAGLEQRKFALEAEASGLPMQDGYLTHEVQVTARLTVPG